MFDIIVAVDLNNGIGKYDKESKQFKTLTQSYILHKQAIYHNQNTYRNNWLNI